MNSKHCSHYHEGYFHFELIICSLSPKEIVRTQTRLLATTFHCKYIYRYKTVAKSSICVQTACIGDCPYIYIYIYCECIGSLVKGDFWEFRPTNQHKKKKFMNAKTCEHVLVP